MALNKDAVFTAAAGYIYTGEVGEVARPTSAEIQAFAADTGLGSGWSDIGHTSREELPEFGFEGGDVETRGTWQSAALAEVQTEALVDYVVIRLHQFDEEALTLYYGHNASTTQGEFAVGSEVPEPSQRALCIVIVDGDRKIAFYAPRASIRREEEVSLAVDQFAALPLRATFLDPLPEDEMGLGHRFAWIAGDATLLNPDAGS